ncbi:MAG TPA: nucleotide exchange factor GrpE [Bacteroidales bacterium]|nr:nucleotide exchange factor GrpE [Bacteroidales bacterium]
MDKDLINSPEQEINDGAEVNQEQKKENKKSKKTSKTILKSKEKKLQDEIELLNQKNEELKDKYLRLVAEYDNFRKRTIKEKIDLRESAKIDVLKDFLPVVDDIERAMTHLTEVKDVEATVEGIRLISQKFLDFIKSQGVEEIISKDQDFNTDFHEAITRFPVEEEEKKGKVIDVVQKGYKINDKIIRFSKVVVGE